MGKFNSLSSKTWQTKNFKNILSVTNVIFETQQLNDYHNDTSQGSFCFV